MIINEKEYYSVTETIEYIHKNTSDEKQWSRVDLRFRLRRLLESDENDIVTKIGKCYYLEFNYLKQSVELLNKSVRASILNAEIRKINPKKTESALSKIINERLGAYRIPLFATNTLYIDSSVCHEALIESKELHEKECINRKELIDKIKSTYIGVSSNRMINRFIDNAIAKYNLEIISADYKYNLIAFTGATLFPKNTVQEVLKYFDEMLVKELTLINISYEEYLRLSVNDFKNDYKEFSQEDAQMIHWGGKYIYDSRELKRTFEETEVKIIKIRNQGVYANKEDLGKFIDLMQNYILATNYFKKIGITFSASTAKANNLVLFKYKHLHYIRKEDIDRYKSIHKYNNSLKDTISLYGRVELKIEHIQHENKFKYPKLKKLILEFAKNSDGDIHNSASICKTYEIILDNIELDLEPNNQLKNNKLFKCLLSKFHDKYIVDDIIMFMNFLRVQKKFNIISASTIKASKPKEPYTSEEFINLLAAMLDIVSDNTKMEKLYRDWRLSTSFAYVLLHYCLAWRRCDLVDNLPIVNLSLISNDFSDGESFIKWLEDGNIISYEQSRVICKSLEEETYRLRKKASKNNELLNCIISDSLMWEIATVLCINEANRQIYFNESKNHNRDRIRRDRCFLKSYTGPAKITEQFKRLKLDITEILNGNFDNTRMNKGFLDLVRDKLEELNLFAYTYVQIIRSHKFKEGQLSETTKIYLNKSIERGALLAFSTGTMGSVLYLLNQLIDNNFDAKTTKQQIEDIKELNITPYQLEKNIYSINNRIKVMDKEMKHYFSGQGKREKFLENLLYGQSFSGIEKKTKCLIKIIRDEENILSVSHISSKDKSPNNKCPLKRRSCIGCDYMIALRYFIYEFEHKYNQVLTNLVNAKSEIDKAIFIQIINDLYIPLLNDLALILGPDKVFEIIDLDRYIKLTEIY